MTPRNPQRESRDNSEEQDRLPRWDYTASGERLTGSQEKFLARRAQAGDRAAQERMLAANIPLVVSIARQFASSLLEPEDLVQEGMIGLCIAVERFDPERGLRFSTYATYWIRQRILRAVDSQGRLIRIPVDAGYAAKKAIAAREQLTEQLGREPTMSELAEVSGVSEIRLQAVMDCLETPLSLDAVGTDGSEQMSIDVVDPFACDPQSQVILTEQQDELESLLSTLSPRDRMVLEGRFGLKGSVVPLADLADRLRMTREGVRQIQRRAILKLRRQLGVQSMEVAV